MWTCSALDCGKDRLRETQQHCAVIFAKRAGLCGKHFDQADYSFAQSYGSREYGANAESAATLAIDAFVGIGVIAAQHSSRAYAFAGKT